jgi:uncharacterized protein YcaQ
MNTVRLTIDQARRIIVCSQMLHARGGGVREVISQLAGIQYDPNPTIHLNQYMVLWNRIPGFTVEDLDREAYRSRSVLEAFTFRRNTFFVPADEFAIYRKATEGIVRWGASDRIKDENARDSVQACQAEDRLRNVLGGAQPVTRNELWTSLGVMDIWRERRQRTDPAFPAFNRMLRRGEIIVAGRRKGTFREPEYALKTEVLPGPWPNSDIPEFEARCWVISRVLRSYGVTNLSHIRQITGFKATEIKDCVETLESKGEARRVAVDSMRGDYWTLPECLTNAETEPDGAEFSLLPPLDNLVRDRNWLLRHFGYTFQFEYFQKKQMKWQLSALLGSDFLGYIDCKMDRARNRLIVKTREILTKDAVVHQLIDDKIEQLARFHGTTDVVTN